MERRVILENLVLQESRNSPHFLEREVSLSLSIEPATCPSPDVFEISCGNVNCVQAFDNVVVLTAQEVFLILISFGGPL